MPVWFLALTSRGRSLCVTDITGAPQQWLTRFRRQVESHVQRRADSVVQERFSVELDESQRRRRQVNGQLSRRTRYMEAVDGASFKQH